MIYAMKAWVSSPNKIHSQYVARVSSEAAGNILALFLESMQDSEDLNAIYFDVHAIDHDPMDENRHSTDYIIAKACEFFDDELTLDEYARLFDKARDILNKEIERYESQK